jgi:hypothetical protein
LIKSFGEKSFLCNPLGNSFPLQSLGIIFSFGKLSFAEFLWLSLLLLLLLLLLLCLVRLPHQLELMEYSVSQDPIQYLF